MDESQYKVQKSGAKTFKNMLHIYPHVHTYTYPMSLSIYPRRKLAQSFHHKTSSITVLFNESIMKAWTLSGSARVL